MGYAYSPQIKYKELNESGEWPEKYRSYQCFSPCKFWTPTKAEFDIDNAISQGALDSFINLSRDLLGNEVEIEQKDKFLEVTVKAQTERYFGLMCMSLLRYVQEFPHVIEAAFKDNDLSGEAAYKAFLESHTEKLLTQKYNNYYGHAVMGPPDSYYIKSKRFDYAKVKNLIKNKSEQSVMGYFSC